MHEQSKRIQTSILNSLEKKVLIWLAERQPKWMTSDILTYIGTVGAIIIAIGYILSSRNINYLWLSTLGFIINWYGDSLDGTLARVRNTQRPVYGYYIDHTVDAINEVVIFMGIGLSGLMHLEFSLMALVAYFLITINVSINAHLKKEFKLTYAGLGPTEFRLIMIIINTIYIYSTTLRNFSVAVEVFGREISLKSLDILGISVTIILFIMYFYEIFNDAKEYAVIDPLKKK
jgi:phosphatidylglycerophosphate synthase